MPNPETNLVGMSLILNPLPQKDARINPMIAMATTEQAAGTALVLPRNWVANSPARVELCIPVQSEIVLQTFSSFLSNNKKWPDSGVPPITIQVTKPIGFLSQVISLIKTSLNGMIIKQ